MKRNSRYVFRKTLRKYRNLQLRLAEATAEPLLRQLSRKLDILQRRLLRLNRIWKLGIATAALMAWMAGPVQAQQFPASMKVDTLDGSNGFMIQGIEADTYDEMSIRNAGDINGDGMDDIIIGDGYADPRGKADAGAAYVIFGANSFNDTLDVGNLNGSNGFVLIGIEAEDFVGRSVSGAGDVNGDGKNDLIIGSPNAGPKGGPNNDLRGESYVVFGADTFNDTLDLATLNGTNGFVISGENETDMSGRAVSGAGDINGDGIDDILIGADGVGQYNAGNVYVVFGANTFSDSLNLGDIAGSSGFAISAADAGDRLGRSVSGAGDVNGDGKDDIIISSRYGDPNGNDDAGESYVIFGASTFADSLNVADLNGMNGFVLNGIDQDDESGNVVSGAGDVNGDGMDDLIIGALYGDPNNTVDAGESYVVFGASMFNDSLNLSDLNGSNGFVINGQGMDHYAGSSVSGAGDVNGDGIHDIMVGTPGASNYDGESYVIFGATTWASSFDPSSLNGSNGFTLKGKAQSSIGYHVSEAGDVNGDGVADIMVSGFAANYEGEVYVIFGRDVNASIDGLVNTLELEAFPNPTSGTLSLRATPFEKATTIEVNLFDLIGRTVNAPYTRTGSDRMELDMTALPKGTYVLQVVADGEVGTSKVVKE